ncbi:MAG: Ig-like domain-containing protein [Bacteroidia bacterium]
MNYKNLIYTLFAALILATTFSGCIRDLEGLEEATFPVNPDVFIDGFPGDLFYAAFGNSKVTAFDVDEEVTYEGRAAMKFSIPNADDPAGGYAGGIFGSAAGRDLSGYNVLTFWARTSQAAVLEEVGFGNDFGENLYVATIKDVKLTSNWQKIIIPLPDASKLTRERGLFLYSDAPDFGSGYTLWIDEVKFENLGTVANPKASILAGQDQNIEAEIGQVLNIGGLTVSANLPNGIDVPVNAGPAYFTFTSSDQSVATVNERGEVSILTEGSAVITAKMGDLDATGSMTITSTAAVGPKQPAPTPTRDGRNVISLYSNAYSNVNVDTWNTRWQFSTAEENFTQVQGDDVIRYRDLNFVGIEFVSQTIDVSEMTHFHLNIWTPDPTSAPANFKILLVDFGPDGTFDGGDDTSHELTFTSPTLTTENWISLDIPLSDFTTLTTKGHMAQLVLSGSLPNIFMDNVYFYK